ncbi:MAG: glutathione S-transferase N-terminal domain-containing protein [Pseudomonadales bacterium]|uniref:Stringent starvation protein A n=1 Tax=marine metagenome TaxID=408172 RepID=A0A381STC3_9ZZZZ|nr:stringent starvation protein A [Gammaproteobacteria bacterium]MCH2353901.1 glutathione S-transferase N-terminal domain-containing protein [Pseudomonadales bacterium]MED5555714.1 glutathione S-transferase N-terminal domain-containing protein [Pseudomonadota bacterium]MEE3133731.1 glutathione S-transferase N-terminal domain-containing protein [Pseudomonadota bacterium]
MSFATKRASMTLFSDPRDHYSHRVRMVLCEKGVSVDVVDVDPSQRPEDLSEINPYGTLPTLLDRDLVLYKSTVIMEYLDERFPHPPLLPVYPVARAQCRLLMHRIEVDWSKRVDVLMAGRGRETAMDKARKELRESLAAIAPVFADRPFFMNDDFTLVDCFVAPILWRLNALDLKMSTRQLKPMQRYMNDMFERDTFQESLTEPEVDMRE